MKRNIYKKALIATYESNISTTPTVFSKKYGEDIDANEFRIFELKGQFKVMEQLGLGPKYKNKVPGYHLYIFFETEDKQKYLVNSGFISSENYKINKLNFPSDTVTIEAMLRKVATPSRFLPDNDLADNFWFSINKEDIKTQFDYNFEDYYFALIDSNLEIPTESFGKGHIEFYDEHVPYIITWFLLSAVLTFLTLIFYRANKWVSLQLPKKQK